MCIREGKRLERPWWRRVWISWKARLRNGTAVIDGNWKAIYRERKLQRYTCIFWSKQLQMLCLYQSLWELQYISIALSLSHWRASFFFLGFLKFDCPFGYFLSDYQVISDPLFEPLSPFSPSLSLSPVVVQIFFKWSFDLRVNSRWRTTRTSKALDQRLWFLVLVRKLLKALLPRSSSCTGSSDFPCLDLLALRFLECLFRLCPRF